MINIHSSAPIQEYVPEEEKDVSKTFPLIIFSSKVTFDPSSLISLDLSNCNLKQIPSNLLALKNLKKLSLKDNLLTHLPSSFCNLQKLVALNLKNNEFSKVPSVLKKMPGIKNLNLKGNPLDSIPFKLLCLPHAHQYKFDPVAPNPHFQINLILTPEINSLRELFFNTIDCLCYPLFPTTFKQCDIPECGNRFLKEHAFEVHAYIPYKKEKLKFTAKVCSEACALTFKKIVC